MTATRRLRGALAGAACAAGLGAALLVAGPAEPSEAPPVTPGTRAVMFVANNWDGTADIVDPDSYERLGRLDVIPDLDERMAEIYADPVRLGYFLAIRALVGEGHDQFADDMFSSHDGREVYISRPSLADVVAIDLQTNGIRWRIPMEGQRADHMGISPDGARLLVSDSTANKVHVIDPRAGEVVGAFESGDSPHENNYSSDGSRIFHASIGLVYTPADQPVFDSTKGDRWFQIVDAGSNEILKRLDIGQIMAAHGHEGYSSAVRPMALAPDEKSVYMQLSFFHGFVHFDMENERPLAVVELPKKTTEPRENYLLDSAHHGLAINPEGTRLCAAGTMDGYAAIVSTGDFSYELVEPVDKPYWSTNSGDGTRCFISASGSDEVVVVDYATAKELARIAVGDHPQRMRMGVIRSEYVGGAPGEASVPQRQAALRVLGARVRKGRLVLRLRMHRRASGRLRIGYAAGGRRVRFRPAIRAGRAFTLRKLLPSGVGRHGLLDVRFAGSETVAGDRVRIRLAPRRARLRHTRSAIDDEGRLTVAGRVSRRARGAVRVRLGYVGGGSRVRFLRYQAPIRDGRWRVRALLPSQAAQSGGRLSIQYTGDARRGIRGEQISRRIKGA